MNAAMVGKFLPWLFSVDFFTQVMCYTERKGREENESLDTVTQRGTAG